MFARLDFPRFLVCCSGDLSDNESEEKPSVAICGWSICILTGLSREMQYLNIKGKGSFYIAQYPVRWTAQSALHFLNQTGFAMAEPDSIRIHNIAKKSLASKNKQISFRCYYERVTWKIFRMSPKNCHYVHPQKGVFSDLERECIADCIYCRSIIIIDSMTDNNYF